MADNETNATLIDNNELALLLGQKDLALLILKQKLKLAEQQINELRIDLSNERKKNSNEQ